MLIWTILILLGIAHEDEKCPPFPMMERMASQGQLTHEMEECLQRDVPNAMMAENQAWVLWLGQWRGGATREARDARARTLLKTSALPDRALWVGQIAANDSPVLAAEALDRAESMALQWDRLSHRIEQLHILFGLRAKLAPDTGALQWARTWVSLGVTGPYLDEALAACRKIADETACQEPIETNLLALGPTDHWMACKNSAHLWSQRVGKRAYSTERDCLLHAAYLMKPGAERDKTIRWALILAQSRDEPHLTGAAMRLFAPTLLNDRNAILVAAEFHRKHGDKAGAQWWSKQAK